MKKLLTMSLNLFLILSLIGCGRVLETVARSNGISVPDEPSITMGETTMPPSGGTSRSNESSAPGSSDETLSEFQKTATISETVLVDENDIIITAVGLTYTDYAVELELAIENNSSEDLSFSSGTLGYSCNSVNGYMVTGGYLNSDVGAGKKANETIDFSYDELLLYGVMGVADIEIGFTITDEKYDSTYTAPKQIKTSLAETYDYEKDHFQEVIRNGIVQRIYGYSIDFFSEETLYDQNDIKVVSPGLLTNKDGDTALFMEVVNTSSEMRHVATTDIAVNGLKVYDATWSTDTINPGKRCVVDVDLSSVLRDDYREILGITEIGTINLSLVMENEDDNPIADPAELRVAIPNITASFDPKGQEVYNEGGLRVIAKALVAAESEYSDDLCALFLIENGTEETISADGAYDSLSVNDFMTDHYSYGTVVGSGESAVMEITLQGSSLSENGISGVADIAEIEFDLSIEDSRRDTIDEPTIVATYPIG